MLAASLMKVGYTQLEYQLLGAQIHVLQIMEMSALVVFAETSAE